MINKTTGELLIGDTIINPNFNRNDFIDSNLNNCICQAKRGPFDKRKGDHFCFYDCTLTIEKGPIC
jgi:hypothetical protein